MDVEKSFTTMKENEIVFLPCTKQKINSRLTKAYCQKHSRGHRVGHDWATELNWTERLKTFNK